MLSAAAAPAFGAVAAMPSSLAACQPPATAYRPDSAEEWFAYSTAAMNVSDDIIFSQTKIVFVNGSALNLHYLGDAEIPAKLVERDAPPPQSKSAPCAAWYAVDPPYSKRVANGNSLCDKAPVFLVATTRSDGEPVLEIYFFRTPDISGSCGSLTYGRKDD